MVSDPADYRWSSYGEAMGGGAKGNGKTARAGLVRPILAHFALVRISGRYLYSVNWISLHLARAGDGRRGFWPFFGPGL
jgi:hypothetical protein